jgi:hypothetical protein
MDVATATYLCGLSIATTICSSGTRYFPSLSYVTCLRTISMSTSAYTHTHTLTHTQTHKHTHNPHTQKPNHTHTHNNNSHTHTDKLFFSATHTKVIKERLHRRGIREGQVVCGWNSVRWFVDGIREGQLVCGWN